MARSVPIRTPGTDMSRIPTPNLPPPYSAHSVQAGKLRPNPSDFTQTSTILVGPKPTRFVLHTTLLTSQSPYFRAALTGPFLESTTNTLTLPDISVPHFSALVSWLYTSSLPRPFKDGKPAYYTLLHMYALADRLSLEGLRNAVVDVVAELADTSNSVLTPSDTRILYDAIRDSAPLRRLVLDLFAFKKTDRLLETHADNWHAAFLRDLVVLLKRPCAQALARHRLRLWCPAGWHSARACDHCRVVLPPRQGAVVCEDCCLAFCTRCAEAGVAMAGWDDGRGKWEVAVDDQRDSTGGGSSEGSTGTKGRKWEVCKPWRGGRCALYHEHEETERCGDVFMGR